MKNNATLQNAFLFNPSLSVAGHWPSARQSKPRSLSRPVSLVTETQIDYKQELICGVILVFCVLFGLAAVVTQFALA